MNKKIINQFLLHGKTSISEKIWLKSVKLFYKLNYKNSKKFINRAIINSTPLLKVKQLKQKKKRSQLKEFPYIVNNQKRMSWALNFFINKPTKKKEMKMYKNFVSEMLSTAKNLSINVNNKKDVYKHAFLKRKYFYYRWF